MLQLSKNLPHGVEQLPPEVVRHPPEALLLRSGVVKLLRKALLLRNGVEHLTLEALRSPPEALPRRHGVVQVLHEALRQRQGVVRCSPRACH